MEMEDHCFRIDRLCDDDSHLIAFFRSDSQVYFILSVVIAALILYRHQSNIARLIQEPKISGGPKSIWMWIYNHLKRYSECSKTVGYKAPGILGVKVSLMQFGLLRSFLESRLDGPFFFCPLSSSSSSDRLFRPKSHLFHPFEELV